MNIDDLERSLRADFEGQIDKALTKLRADLADLQKNCESELDKHRSQLDDIFRSANDRISSSYELDQGFNESVNEHLRLARDEGAQITALALGEAEKLSQNGSNSEIEKLRSGINEIKANSTQVSILKALVDAATGFAPRGAFFIVKNDHFVGWRVFGHNADENTVRSVRFSVDSDSAVADAIRSLATVKSSAIDQADNGQFLDPLAFGVPETMYAIPLVARGRGVAVLYADAEGAPVNLEALETLVAVAGLRVELLAASASAGIDAAPAVEASQPEPVAEVEPVVERSVEVEPEVEYSTVPNFESDQDEVHAESVVEPVVEEPVAQEQAEIEVVPEPEVPVVQEYEVEYAGAVEGPQAASPEPEPVYEVEHYAEAVPNVEPVPQVEITSDHAFAPSNFDSSEAAAVEPEVQSLDPVVEPVVEQAVAEAAHVISPESNSAREPRTYRERTMDLPIEVSDDERKPHSDARRFARLLVSEIRLYNEQKVIEGRESGEIYDLLKEAIDRSREMYEKRVSPGVASKFDYFHYELVNSLAEGDEEKLGASYMAVRA